jgi:hypothetical protein
VGRPKQISPRDATISKHFYSIDIAAGRSQAVEEALGQVESVAAPHVRAIASGEFPMRESRAELALFIAMAYLRTPTWRDKAKSLADQVETAWGTERLSERSSPRRSQTPALEPWPCAA